MAEKGLSRSITLPASKSISNRLLILNALSENPGRIENLSASDDTRVLEKALATGGGTIDIGHAGTAMRFLTAYLSIRDGRYLLTGSERMQQRPVGKLVEALKELGADVSYTGNPGYPPLSIRGKKLEGGEISIDSSVSSQYISALMMIGPVLEKGLTIHLRNQVVSASYIHLTEKLMMEMGIPVKFSGTRIEIPSGPIVGKDTVVEGDWSAASYWYALAALSEQYGLQILGLRQDSMQGDSILPELFRPLGVETVFREDGIALKRIPLNAGEFVHDFSDHPDLVQTMVVLCGLLGLPFRMTGTRTLKIKETDRILALQLEMKKLGIPVDADPDGEWIAWDGKSTGTAAGNIQIKTYRDHRMAMAFSPAALRHPGLYIEDPEVVHKSYPDFWKDLEAAGFRVDPVN